MALTQIDGAQDIKAASVTESELNASIAGPGLSGAGGDPLAVSVDDVTVEIQTDSLQLKASGVTSSHLSGSVAGDGLTGGGGTALAVNVDSSTLTIATDTVQVADAGITETQLASSVAGNGLTGGAGSALSVNKLLANWSQVSNLSPTGSQNYMDLDTEIDTAAGANNTAPPGPTSPRRACSWTRAGPMAWAADRWGSISGLERKLGDP